MVKAWIATTGRAMFAIVPPANDGGDMFGYQYFADHDQRPRRERWERWLRCGRTRSQAEQKDATAGSSVGTDGPSGAHNGGANRAPVGGRTAGGRANADRFRPARLPSPKAVETFAWPVGMRKHRRRGLCLNEAWRRDEPRYGGARIARS